MRVTELHAVCWTRLHDQTLFSNRRLLSIIPCARSRSSRLSTFPSELRGARRRRTRISASCRPRRACEHARSTVYFGFAESRPSTKNGRSSAPTAHAPFRPMVSLSERSNVRLSCRHVDFCDWTSPFDCSPPRHEAAHGLPILYLMTLIARRISVGAWR